MRRAVANVKTVCGSIRRTVKIYVQRRPLREASVTGTGQMMNCKLDAAVYLIVAMERGAVWWGGMTENQQRQVTTSVYDESCPKHALDPHPPAVALS